MTEEKTITPDKHKERRSRRGTWPWFVLNVILFPAPGHSTLLRVRDFSLSKSIFHLGITFLLFFILLVSAFLQVVFPSIGRLWMLLPIASGFAIVFSNRSLITDFKPFNLISDYRNHLFTLMILLFFFTVINILPELDLIELQEKRVNISISWIETLPLWQESIIFIVGLLVVLIGYMTNSTSFFSINRIVILYACYLIFIYQIHLILGLAFYWLCIPGGFGSHLLWVFLAAVLALDYWDAISFGQYTRRYFFLTWTKGISFIFLWLCFMGLPQKAASIYSSYAYRHAKPIVAEIPYDHLIFTDRDRFKSAHEATRRLRTLYSTAFLTDQPGMLKEISHLLDGTDNSIFHANTDIGQMQNLLKSEGYNYRSLSDTPVPFFRPVHPDWDVMLTALVMQGIISESDINKIIAGFKSMLPKSSQGHLPDLDTPYDVHFVTLATETRVDFIPPLFELIEIIHKNNFIPVLSLRLAGKDHWAALLSIDQDSSIAWFRIENKGDIEEAIQLLFDSNEAGEVKNDILSYQLVPLSLKYFRTMVGHYSNPIIVFSQNGLGNALPDKFNPTSLQDMKKAVAFIGHRQKSTGTIPGRKKSGSISNYAGYLAAVTHLKALLRQTKPDPSLFLNPNRSTSSRNRSDRLNLFRQILNETAPLRDNDRIHLAYLLAANHGFSAAADLFVQLVAKQPASNDLIDCRDAFTIGRRLFLLGYYEKASDYLEIAFSRHPFNSEYELWYHIVLLKLKKTLPDFYSPPSRQPYLYLYYKTISDIEKGNSDAALKRLEKVLEKDSHDSLANHLLARYFQRPLNEKFFFPVQEGL